jgi:hypothetical protein
MSVRLLVVLSGATTAPATGLAGDSLLEQRLAGDADTRVEVVRFAGPAGLVVGPSRAILDRVLRAMGAYALRDRFSRSPIGRLLNSLGPVDQGRVFWRAVRNDRGALTTLKSADVVVASDLAAAKTAWIAVHRGWVREATYDHAARGYLAVLDAAVIESTARADTASSDTSD